MKRALLSKGLWAKMSARAPRIAPRRTFEIKVPAQVKPRISSSWLTVSCHPNERKRLIRSHMSFNNDLILLSGGHPGAMLYYNRRPRSS
ncbi:hypothetical protein CDAR_99351 [Caerostris darwini]|uniref:Uncharacterized protein n=1 Tax=Caerostris darwini TaxID=1538125 RepID=A0AAV4Q1V9_9ARAC|nr:hypothetical protein CDAR_99351 [Caerostris darwini]